MFFKSKKPEIVKEDSRIEDFQIITKLSQEFATSLDLSETLQNSLDVIIKRINAQAANVFLIEEKNKFSNALHQNTKHTWKIMKFL